MTGKTHLRHRDLLFWASYYIRGLLRVAKSEHDASHGPYCICGRAEQWMRDMLKASYEEETK